jgi:hypothetical protein
LSPEAFTVTVAAPALAAEEAVKVSFEEPLSAVRVTGLALHEAVTPLGSPVTLRVTAPLYVLLPESEIRSVAVAPLASETEVEAAETASVGAGAVTVSGRFWVAE